MLGIRTVWNGGTPSAIPWHSPADIVRAIQLERATIGTVWHNISAAVKNMLRVDPALYLVETHTKSI
jgi:hypothetical protein